MSRKIQCPKCHDTFIWNESSPVVQCPRCGTQYQFRSVSQHSQPVLMPRVGRGAVDYLTVPNDNIIRNRPLIQSYIPKNWNYHCSLADNRFDLVSNPFVLSVTFAPPDNSSKIVFVGESFYKHIDPTPQTAALQNRLDDLTVSRNPSFLRLKSYMDADSYCNALAQSCGLHNLSVSHQQQPSPSELTQQKNAVQNFLSNGFTNVTASWAGKTYSGITPDYQHLKVYAETRVIRLNKMSVVSSMQMTPMGSIFGMRMMPQMVQQQVQELFWDTQYEWILLATESMFDRAYAELQHIMSTFDYLPDIAQARADAMVLANNTLMNISQNRSASFARQSQIIADTNAYTSNIQHQMFNDNAASHDRVANLHSEMIREVNSYHTINGGTVEVASKYDHAYQNTQNPDLFAVQEGDSYVFGVDFVELPKNNGSN